MAHKLLRRNAAVEERSFEDRLLAKVAEGGRKFDQLVFTGNRRVMVSVGDGGRTLRVHRTFAFAEPEVLRAIGGMYGARSEAARERARERVRRFVVDTIVPLNQSGADHQATTHLPTRRLGRAAGPRPVHSGDVEYVRQMKIEFDRVNALHFDGALPDIHIAISDRMRRRNGHFSRRPLEIVISRRLFTHAAPGEAEHTMRHEMIHFWQHVEGRTPGHGLDFRECARRIGVHPRAKRIVQPLERAG